MIAEIERVVGRERLWQLAPDGEVSRALGVEVSVAVEPPDEAALAAVLEVAGRRRYRTAAWGSGRHASGGAPSGPIDLLVVTASLRGVRHFDPDDETITVAAGTPLADVVSALEGSGLALPFDVPPGGRGTLGGFLAAGLRTPLATGLGPARDHLLGARFALPRFGVVKSGGRLVKNVTGYDLFRLHLGARGRFGILADASLRLRPLPEAAAAGVARFAEAQQVARFLTAVRGSGRGSPARLRLAPAAVWSRLFGDDGPGSGALGFTVLFDHEGLAPHVAARSREATESARRAGGDVVAMPPEARGRLLERAGWPAGILGEEGGVELEIRHPLFRAGTWTQPGLMDAIVALGASRGVELNPVGDPLVGRLSVFGPADAPPELFAAAVELASRSGARARLVAAPLATRRACAGPLRAMRGEGERRVERRLLAALDPDEVLSAWASEEEP